MIEKIVDKILGRKDYITVSGSTIAASHRRLSGLAFKDNDVYLKSAEGEAHRLIQRFQCTRESRI